MRAASIQVDPFKSFLEAHRGASAPVQSLQPNQVPATDPFKAAVEESERQRAAGRASPFGK
jgi:hypothetical protein